MNTYNTMMLHMNDLTKRLFENIGKYRTVLMGGAMILVFLYHAPSKKLGFMPTGILGTLCEKGDRGVDIFLFLSAFGLCYSLKKNTIKRFYFNRFKRVIPTWWVVLFSLHIIGIFMGSKFANERFIYPHSITDIFFWYTGLGYFVDKCHYEWYIPTLLLLYLLIPMINKLSRNNLLLIILLSIPIIVLYKECGHLSYLYLSISRIPIFLLGILFFKDTEQNDYNLFFTTCVILWIYIFAFSHFWKMPSVTQDAPLVPIVTGLLGFVLSFKYTRFIEVFLTFVGTISLEFYLIHPCRRPQYLLSHFTKNSELQVLGAFVLCLVLSYLLHLVMKKVNEKILFANNQ